MPFKNERFFDKAANGEVAGIALSASLALRSIVMALAALKAGKDITENLKEIEEEAERLDKMFDALSGWTPE